jgi:phytoene dehydrogenase-like protein
MHDYLVERDSMGENTMIAQSAPTLNGRASINSTSRDDQQPQIDVAVVGGGLAGLAAAITAAHAGRSVVLYEAASAIGGRARTREDQGFHFNVGAHAMYRNGRGIDVLRELGVEPKGGTVDVSDAVLVDGDRVHALPASARSFFTTTFLDTSARLDLGAFLAKLSFTHAAALDGITVQAWLNSALHTPAARSIIAVLVRTAMYSGAFDVLSAGAALRQLKVALGNVLYLDGGWQSLVDELRRRALTAGVRIMPGARVVAVEHGDAVRAVRLADGTCQPVSAVVLALGPDEASALFDGQQPDLARWASTASPVRVASFDLGLRRLPRQQPRLAFGVDRPLFQSVHSAYARLAPEGAALLHTTRYLGESERANDDTEHEIEQLLDLTQPGWRDEVVVRRFVPSLVVSNALPTVAWQTGGGPAEVSVPGLAGLLLAGDWVGHEGMLADRALTSASRAGVQAAEVAARLAGARS